MCPARHTSTSITLGSRRTVVPLRKMALRLGLTSQGPTRKSSVKTSPTRAKQKNYKAVFQIVRDKIQA